MIIELDTNELLEFLKQIRKQAIQKQGATMPRIKRFKPYKVFVGVAKPKPKRNGNGNGWLKPDRG